MSATSPDLAAREAVPQTAGGGRAPLPWASPESSAPSPAGANRFVAVSSVLRAAGSVALVAALSTFLWQHWEAGGALWRAGTLLAHSVGLALAGLLCGLGARDGKAARTFLGLAGASLPILSCVAGGLLYSQLAWDAPGSLALPGYATWVAPSAASALAAALVALVAAAPIAALAMGVFARRCMPALAAACVAGNALLLVPTRDPDAIAALAGASLAGLAWLEWRVLRHEPSLANLEGMLARALVWVLPAVLVGRSVLHYALSPLFHAVGWFALAAGLMALSLAPALPAAARALARWAALAPAFWAASAFASAALAAGMTGGLALPVAAAGFALQAGAASLAAGDEVWGRQFRRLAAAAVVVACAFNLWLVPGVVASLLAGVASIALLAFGTLREERALQLAGAAGALAAVAVHVQQALAFYAWSRWGSLALLGVAVIAAASWVERCGPAALARLELWRRRLGEGEA